MVALYAWNRIQVLWLVVLHPCTQTHCLGTRRYWDITRRSYKAERDAVSLWAEKAVITMVIRIQREARNPTRCLCSGKDVTADWEEKVVMVLVKWSPRWWWKRRRHDLVVSGLHRDTLHRVLVCYFYLDLTSTHKHPWWETQCRGPWRVHGVVGRQKCNQKTRDRMWCAGRQPRLDL